MRVKTFSVRNMRVKTFSVKNGRPRTYEYPFFLEFFTSE